MKASDLLVLSRRASGLSQGELARRLGRPQSTVARWETGRMEPTFAALTEAVKACGKQLVTDLAEPDHSLLHDVDEQLRLEPLQRVRVLGGQRRVEALLRLAESGTSAIVIGDTAAALSGWPLMLPTDGEIEVCAQATGHLGDLTGITVTVRPPGTRGYADLRRDQQRLDIRQGGIWLASLIDLARIAAASRNSTHASALEAVLEHHRRWPHGPPARREYSDDEALEAIETWLARK